MTRAFDLYLLEYLERSRLTRVRLGNTYCVRFVNPSVRVRSVIARRPVHEQASGAKQIRSIQQLSCSNRYSLDFAA